MKLFANKPKGGVIKNGTEGGGRDSTGSPKLLDRKSWANKLLQKIGMGYEAIRFRMVSIF